MRKEIFPSHRISKLYPRGDGLFQVIDRINDNAYKLEVSSEYNISATFNVYDLCPFDVGDLRSNPFEKKGNDENHLATPHDPLYVLIEPIIRARAKEIKEAFNGLI
jgi:hypothetical protein